MATMLIYLDETEFFKAFRANPTNANIIAFLSSNAETFRRMLEVYDFSEADLVMIEDAVRSGRITLRPPLHRRPTIDDFQKWLERWCGVTFTYANFTTQIWFQKADAKVAMLKSGQFEEHEIFC